MNGDHILIVGPFDPDDATDRFDVEHPADCPQSARYSGPDGEDINDYDCAVGVCIADGGIDCYFAHADDDTVTSAYVERVPEGRHLIEYWSIRHPGGPWGPDEWDGGVRTVEHVAARPTEREQ